MPLVSAQPAFVACERCPRVASVRADLLGRCGKPRDGAAAGGVEQRVDGNAACKRDAECLPPFFHKIRYRNKVNQRTTSTALSPTISSWPSTCRNCGETSSRCRCPCCCPPRPRRPSQSMALCSPRSRATAPGLFPACPLVPPAERRGERERRENNHTQARTRDRRGKAGV